MIFNLTFSTIIWGKKISDEVLTPHFDTSKTRHFLLFFFYSVHPLKAQEPLEDI